MITTGEWQTWIWDREKWEPQPSLVGETITLERSPAARYEQLKELSKRFPGIVNTGAFLNDLP